MAKSDRLFDLMQLLRRHSGPVAGSELASQTNVSVRTIYRDIATLQSLGADIEGEPGFGYVLNPGFLLPPLMFTNDELHALALGAQWVARQTDDGLATAAEDAMAKIGAVLPSDMRHLLSDNAFHVGRDRPDVPGIDLAVVRVAIREQCKLRMFYRDPRGSVSERVLWPIAIGFIDTRRFVAGWCELRSDFRTFRIDRIKSLETLEERYAGRRRDLVRRWRRIEDERSAKSVP